MNPGSVSSAERPPPPIVRSASKTITFLPARARTMAAARPFGPDPTTTASGLLATTIPFSRRAPRACNDDRDPIGELALAARLYTRGRGGLPRRLHLRRESVRAAARRAWTASSSAVRRRDSIRRGADPVLFLSDRSRAHSCGLGGHHPAVPRADRHPAASRHARRGGRVAG